MIRPEAATLLLEKSERALRSARILLEIGDFEGTCNRAYYAMFDAAKAALVAAGSHAPGRTPKTHSGLMHAFGESIIKARRLPEETGRHFKLAERLRLAADYQEAPIAAQDVVDLMKNAEAFVAAVRGTLPGASGP